MEMIIDLIKELPWFADLVMLIGLARLVFKPLFSFIDAMVSATPTQKDDIIWEKAKNSKVFTSIIWVLDYLASIKIPTKKG